MIYSLQSRGISVYTLIVIMATRQEIHVQPIIKRTIQDLRFTQKFQFFWNPIR